MPYSRATTAQWLRMPPVSDTTAAAMANRGVHGGAVVAATSTSWGCSLRASAKQNRTRAVPTALPGAPGRPEMVVASAQVGSRASGPKNLASAAETGSVGAAADGGAPTVGGTAMVRKYSISARRAAIRERRFRRWNASAVSRSSSGSVRNTSSGRSRTAAAAKRRPTSSEIRCTWCMQRKRAGAERDGRFRVTQSWVR